MKEFIRMLQVGWQFSRAYCFHQMISLILQSFKIILFLLFSRQIGYALMELNMNKVMWSLAILFMIFIIDFFETRNQSYIKTKNVEIDGYFEDQIFKSIMNLPYADLESEQIQDELYKIHWGIMVYGSFSQIVTYGVAIIRQLITFCSIAVILQNLHPLFLLCLILILCTYLYLQKKSLDVQLKYENQTLEIERKYSRFVELLLGNEYAKDVRLYDAKDIFEQKFDEHSVAPYYKQRFQKQFVYLGIADALEALTILCIYAYVLLEIYRGEFAIGSFILYISLIQTLVTTMQEFGVEIFNFKKAKIYIKTYFAFITKSEQSKKAYVPFPKEWKQICFEHVYFQYPNTKELAVRDLSVTIHRGERISVVGTNGAGKSTFVKLLLGLYPVTAGDIKIDNVSIQDIDPKEWMKQISATYQDFKFIQFSLYDNMFYLQEQKNALLPEIFHHLSLDFLLNQMHHFYTKRFDRDGVQLSGGQNQRLAIARGLLKEAQLLVLDEPTAALDPISEVELYETVNTLSQGLTLIFITHRLASCQFSDRIFFFDQGTIVEEGKHNALMNLKGKYAQFYEEQAKLYLK